MTKGSSSAFSKIEIPRLGISVVIVEGVEPRFLKLAAGHVPGTAMPGESGNVAIAAHRDDRRGDAIRSRLLMAYECAAIVESLHVAMDTAISVERVRMKS